MGTTVQPSAGERTAILVTGMHRSGTSALAGVLARLGAGLPAEPIPGPEGDIDFYEPRAVVDLNQQILIEEGSWWGGWQSIEAEPNRHRALVAAARDVLGKEYGDQQDLIVLKDPRVSRLLPVWREAVEGLGYRCVTVLALRDPGEVAASIRGRNRLQGPTTALGWLAHVLDAESGSRDLPRVVVSLDRLARDWRSEMDRVGQRLGITWPRSLDEAATEISEFLDPRTVHREPVTAPETDEVYHLLSRWAEDDVAPDDLQVLDRWRDRLAPIRSLPSVSSHLAHANLEQDPPEIRGKRKMRPHREHAGYDREAELAWRIYSGRADGQHAAARDQRVLALERQLAFERERAKNGLTSLSVESSQRIRSLRDDVTALSSELVRVRARLEQRNAELKDLRTEVRTAIRPRARAGRRAIRMLLTILQEEARHQRRVDVRRRSDRLRAAAERLRESGLFDQEAYLRDHPDVAASGLPPEEHVLLHGKPTDYLTLPPVEKEKK